MSRLRFIHIGDLHGHLVPRPLRSDSSGGLEGGLARMATLIGRLRAEQPHSILINTGDTIQGSAEEMCIRDRVTADPCGRVYVSGNVTGNSLGGARVSSDRFRGISG